LRKGLYDFIYGEGRDDERFKRCCAVVGSLPHPKTRVLTWPVVTVFAFIALPRIHYFCKPTVTRVAAQAYGYPLTYASRPSWEVYQHALEFARTVRKDLSDLRPRDMIDIQSFLWVLGSAEYPDWRAIRNGSEARVKEVELFDQRPYWSSKDSER